MNLNDWKIQYLEYCTLQRNLAALTIKAYTRDLDAFIMFHQKSMPKLQADEVADSHISEFLIHEFQNKISAKSIARYRSSISNLFNYIMKKKGIKSNPVALVNTPKVHNKLPEVLDVDTMLRLVTIPLETEIAFRDKAIIELFYSSGLRLSELSSLHWSDVDFDQSLVTVSGKGNKQRVIPVGLQALKALKKWHPIAMIWDIGKLKFIFMSKRSGQLKPRSIQARIKYWAQQQGLWERVYPHLLRHSFASHILESSGDLRSVQEMLGHADISTTQIYTHLNFQHLAKVYDKAHPRARKK